MFMSDDFVILNKLKIHKIAVIFKMDKQQGPIV